MARQAVVPTDGSIQDETTSPGDSVFPAPAPHSKLCLHTFGAEGQRLPCLAEQPREKVHPKAGPVLLAPAPIPGASETVPGPTPQGGCSPAPPSPSRKPTSAGFRSPGSLSWFRGQSRLFLGREAGLAPLSPHSCERRSAQGLTWENVSARKLLARQPASRKERVPRASSHPSAPPSGVPSSLLPLPHGPRGSRSPPWPLQPLAWLQFRSHQPAAEAPEGPTLWQPGRAESPKGRSSCLIKSSQAWAGTPRAGSPGAKQAPGSPGASGAGPLTLFYYYF